MFTTLAALRLCPDGRVHYVNLGHPPVLVRRADGTVHALPAQAPPLGTFALDRYPAVEFVLSPGEMLCMYTDGLSEAERDAGRELFGVSRIEAHLTAHATPQGAHRALTDAVRAWDVTDDFTLALVQYVGEVSA